MDSEKNKLFGQRAAFFAVIVLKILLMGLFSSDYQVKMFEPFVSDWLDDLKNGVINPYQTYYENGMHFDFPYPVGMLFIIGIGGLLTKQFAGTPMFIHNVLFKLPLLAFDILGYVYLKKMFPDKKESYFFVYLLSPISLYGIFMHGQLDIISMTFVMIALYYIMGQYSERNYVLSAVFLSLSLITKLHVAAIVPLIVIYLYKKAGSLKAMLYTLEVCVLSGAALTIFRGEGFTEGVILNGEIGKLFACALPFGDLSLYLPFFALALMYLYILNMNIINEDLLIGLCGMIFAVFLSLCAPMPGWYMWALPFIAAFMIKVNLRRDSLLCYILLNAMYLIYFIFFHSTKNVTDLYFCGIDCSSLKINSVILRNVCFTLLTGVLVYLIHMMHKFGIAEMGVYSFHDKNFVIGISGDSGSGKTSLQNKLCDLFTEKQLLVIEGDGDHKWERGNEKWKEYTHLDPKANFLYRQAMDIYKLKNGESVHRVNYDHSTGKFTKTYTISPKKFISISGLHTLYLPQLRDNINLKIYMDADEELRCLWKIQRDVNARGYSPEKIREQIRARRNDAMKYLIPQKEYADIIFHYTLDSSEPFIMGMKIWINTQIDIEEIIETLREMGVPVSYDFSEDLRYQIVEYHSDSNAEIKDTDFEKIYFSTIDNSHDITGIRFNASGTADGIQKLLLMKAINSKMRMP